MNGLMRFTLVFVVATFMTRAASAQPLADRVPQDALVYVGWAGSESMGAGFADSRFKAVLDASQVRQLIDEAIPRLFARVGQANGPRGAELHAALGAIAGPMWRHPSAMYFGGMDLTNPDMPSPKFALLCDAGQDGKAMAEQFRKLMAQAQGFPMPFRIEESDGLVVFAIGNVEVAAAKKPVTPLSNRKEFKAAMAQVGKDAVAVLYSDVENQIDQLDQMFNQFAPDPFKLKWTAVRDALGLLSLKRIVVTGGFDGRDWSTQMLIASPEPRAGLVKALIDTKPLSEDALKLIPKTATTAAAGHFDPGGLVAAVLEAVKKIEPGVAEDIDRGREQFFQTIGLDLQADILDTFGDEWVAYTDPAVGGQGLLGITFVNRLKNPAKAEKALSQLENVFNAAMKQETAREKMTVAFNQAKRGDLTIHYLSVPVVAPSWAIKDGNLYLALYPQMVSGAADHVASKGPTILDNEAFAAIRARLAVTGATAFSFSDLPKTAAEGYQEVLMISRLYLGLADLFGARTPAMTLPPLAKLMPHVAPAGGVCWVDKEGWHMKSVQPFPGSAVLASGGLGSTMMLAQQGALFLGFAVPVQRKVAVQAEVHRAEAETRQAEREQQIQRQLEPQQKGNK